MEAWILPIRKVISWCEIPEEIRSSSLDDFMCGCYVTFTVEEKGKDPMSDWIVDNYSNIKHGEDILIDIDY